MCRMSTFAGLSLLARFSDDLQVNCSLSLGRLKVDLPEMRLPSGSLERRQTQHEDEGEEQGEQEEDTYQHTHYTTSRDVQIHVYVHAV